MRSCYRFAILEFICKVGLGALCTKAIVDLSISLWRIGPILQDSAYRFIGYHPSTAVLIPVALLCALKVIRIILNNRKTALSLRRILRITSGSVWKRIDENRELLCLLDLEANGFMREHPWVRGWLKRQDDFLVDLSSTPEAQDAIEDAVVYPPRPWPDSSEDCPRAKVS